MTEHDVKTFRTPEPVRLAFPALFEPAPVMRGETDTKYQATLLLPAGADIGPYQRAMKAAMIEKWGKVVKLPASKIGLKRITEEQAEKYDGFELGGFKINCRSNYPPGVVDERAVPVSDPNTVYAGCWVYVFLTCYAWDNQFGKGVNFGLEAVQKVRDDKRFAGGKIDPTKAFAPLKGSGKPKAASFDDVLGFEGKGDDDDGDGDWMEPPAGVRPRADNDDEMGIPF